MNQEDSLRAEIHQALDLVGGPTPDLTPRIAERLSSVARRRPLTVVLRGAAVLGLALVLGAVILSTHRPRVTPLPVVSAPTRPVLAGPEASIAWVTSQMPGSGDIVTGIDSAGHIVGRINAPVDLRSPDGAHLYALGSREIDVFSAADGHQESTIPLHSVRSPSIELLSPDGRYLAVTGGTMLELIDLNSARSIASSVVDVPSYGAPVIVGQQAQHIYVVGDGIVKLAFDGSTLRVQQRTTGHPLACNGLVLGGANSGGGLPFRVLNDGRTLVAFCPGTGTVTWFDLEQMRVTHEIRNSQANPFWVSPVFAADGNTLYLHEGGTGALAAVDLIHARIEKSARVAMAGPGPLAWLGSLLIDPAYAGGIPRTAALSPDGRWLYAVGIFGARGGVSVVKLPDLSLKGRWVPNVSFDSVWASADGQTIYVLTQSQNVVRLIHPDGSQVATLTLPQYIDAFIVPSIS